MADPHAYLVVSSFNNRAHCQCGFKGKRWWFRGNAVLDAIEHCQVTKHKAIGLPPINQMQGFALL